MKNNFELKTKYFPVDCKISAKNVPFKSRNLSGEKLHPSSKSQARISLACSDCFLRYMEWCSFFEILINFEKEVKKSDIVGFF